MSKRSGKRRSASVKEELVLRLMRGEDLQTVGRESAPCAGSPGNGQTPVEFKHQTWRTSTMGYVRNLASHLGAPPHKR